MTAEVRTQTTTPSATGATQNARDAGIEVTPREVGIGVEIDGLDLASDLSSLEVELLQALLRENRALVFPKVVPDIAARRRLDRLFGPTSGLGSSWRWDANGILISIQAR